MAIAAGGAITGKTASGSSLTISSVAVSGSNAAVLVGFFTATTDVATGVTFNGGSLSQLSKQQEGGGRWQYLYGGTVTAATADVVISISATDLIVANGGWYTGVDSLASAGSNTASGTSFSMTKTISTDQSWIAGFTRNSGATITAGAGTTVRAQLGTDLDTAFLDSNAGLSTGSQSIIGSCSSSKTWWGDSVIIVPATAATDHNLTLLGVGT